MATSRGPAANQPTCARRTQLHLSRLGSAPEQAGLCNGCLWRWDFYPAGPGFRGHFGSHPLCSLPTPTPRRPASYPEFTPHAHSLLPNLCSSILSAPSSGCLLPPQPWELPPTAP